MQAMSISFKHILRAMQRLQILCIQRNRKMSTRIIKAISGQAPECIAG